MGIFDQIVEHVGTLDIYQKIQYLESLHETLTLRTVVLVDKDTKLNMNDRVLAWAKDQMHGINVPDDYFEHVVTDIFNSVHPMMQDQVRLNLVNHLLAIGREEARANPRAQIYNDEQFEILYHQTQIWVALNEPRPATGLN